MLELRGSAQWISSGNFIRLIKLSAKLTPMVKPLLQRKFSPSFSATAKIFLKNSIGVLFLVGRMTHPLDTKTQKVPDLKDILERGLITELLSQPVTRDKSS